MDTIDFLILSIAWVLVVLTLAIAHVKLKKQEADNQLVKSGYIQTAVRLSRSSGNPQFEEIYEDVLCWVPQTKVDAPVKPL